MYANWTHFVCSINFSISLLYSKVKYLKYVEQQQQKTVTLGQNMISKQTDTHTRLGIDRIFLNFVSLQNLSLTVGSKSIYIFPEHTPATINYTSSATPKVYRGWHCSAVPIQVCGARHSHFGQVTDRLMEYMWRACTSLARSISLRLGIVSLSQSFNNNNPNHFLGNTVTILDKVSLSMIFHFTFRSLCSN